ncbi:MAG: hypothetical protein ACK4NS_07700 [Saprospiraceae bacterium]
MSGKSKIWLSAFALALFAHPLFSQSYKTAAGVRFDGGPAISVQQHIADRYTAEGILHTGLLNSNKGATLLARKHHKILFRGVNIYYGAGGHYYLQNAVNRSESDVAENVWGLSFVGGAELSLGRLNFSIDFKPELHLHGDQTYPFSWQRPTLSARYVLAKRERRPLIPLRKFRRR